MTNMLIDQRIDRVVNLKPVFPIPRQANEAHTMSQKVAYLLSNLHESLPGSEALITDLHRDLSLILLSAFDDKNPVALLDVHKTLYMIYEVSFGNPMSPICAHEYSYWLIKVRNAIEKAWLDHELPRIKKQLPCESEAKHPKELCAWFVAHAKKESTLDKQVVNFLEHKSSKKQFELFVLSDAHLNYRFYDALALAQHHFSETVKNEIAHHMWDECGCGVAENAHTRQFTRALIELDIPDNPMPIWEDWRPYAGHNFYFCFGLNRKHYFKALGSLAMPELFDPDRNRSVVAAFARLYSDSQVKGEYFSNHVENDEEHGERWLSHVISPIVEVQPEAGMELAIGGALRMKAMRHYNEYLAIKFGLLD